MKLYNMQGKLLKSVQAKSRNVPKDIAVTQSGDLVYADYDERSINLRDYKQTKVVCYSRSTEQQTIQKYDQAGSATDSQSNIPTSDFINHRIHIIDQDQDLNYIHNCGLQGPFEPKEQGYIMPSRGAESSPSNRPLRGDPRLITEIPTTGYRYLFNVSYWMRVKSGQERDYIQTKVVCYSRSTEQQPIQKDDKAGTATDSQSNIPTSDFINHRIHIIDQDQDLNYIHNCGQQGPFGLCVYSR
uniref:Uncharacterized protein LOC111112356 n=1 Tax=Crassostrea virginica TaxID=6565 RepID=A0A8B8BQC4_CRAVI|nr:uncharacterized protein LOC111112356 [Crassostrea virginica]